MAKILVVDDAEFLRLRISKILTEGGHEVLEAENGVQAINKYQSEVSSMKNSPYHPNSTDNSPQKTPYVLGLCPFAVDEKAL